MPEAIPAAELPDPLTWEAVLNAKAGLSVVLALNQRVFVKNTSDQPQGLPSGTVLAGWFKGKFWHYQRSGTGEPKRKKRKEDQPDEVTDADVLFCLEDADSLVSFKGKPVCLGNLVQQRRDASRSDALQYHTKQDKPSPGKPGWFKCTLDSMIYFRAEDIPVKSEDGGTPKIPIHHLAGCMKASEWETTASKVIWAVKWSDVESKGLTPVRPMVVTSREIKIPSQSAVELLKAPTPGATSE